jgi:GNAT superfamily N-acetyltransferase
MLKTAICKRIKYPCSKDYYEQIAYIHQNEIGEGFLPTLGIKFLSKLYSRISRSEYTFLIAAFIDNEIVGFLAGSLDTRKFYKEFIIRDGLFFLPILLPQLLSLDAILKVRETLLYPQKKEEVSLPNSEILNFCVSQKNQRKGVGKVIYKYAIEEFLRLNVNKVKIVTGCTQISAQSFYESFGASLATKTEIHKNVSSLIYIHDLID